MIKSKLTFQFLSCLSSGLFLLLVTACSESEPPNTRISMDSSESAEISVLREQLSSLQKRAQGIKDANDIKRLQRAYGYYVDEALWDEVADLFAENATFEFALDGVYRGKDRIREYLYRLGGGKQGLNYGQINEHFQLMPVVTLAEDGMSAKGRWRDLILSGQYQENAIWGEGPYENEYIKEDGIWKINKLHWYQTMMVPYEGGWITNVDVNGGKYVSEEFPPDEMSTLEYETWPSTFFPPFHFSNPVATYVPSVDSEGGE